MKTIFSSYKHLFWIGVAVWGAGITACTNLEVPIESAFTSDNFLRTEREFIAAAGPAYRSLQTEMAEAYWFLQELTTDEAVLPARGTSWFDGGKWKELHQHTWTADHEHVRRGWEWGFKSIVNCNRILSLFEEAEEVEAKQQFIAEIKTIRALFYFYMMDLYGDIPILPDFGNASLPSQTSRNEVFTFIEAEVLSVLDNLSGQVDGTTYGRPTKWMAYALLAKLYLNAEVYVGVSKYDEAIAACNQIINSGNYNLEADYMSIFASDNGPQIQETIFAVPYDTQHAKGLRFARYSLHKKLQDKYELLSRPTNAMCTLAEFPDYYTEEDARNEMWLKGKQYDFNGDPIVISTTNKGLDASYSGESPDEEADYHLEFTPFGLIEEGAFNVGADELGIANGIRNIKYYPDKNAIKNHQNNDFAVFRYADILLMKAEAILRGGADSDGVGPEVLVNAIRTRAGVSEFASVNLTTLFEERSREMAWEGWRRNDLIRFGKWEDNWGYKTNRQVTRQVYPIPTTELVLNPNLIQNSGY